MTANEEIASRALELITWASGCLEESGVKKPRLNAELLLAYCTGRTRTEIYAYPEREVSLRERDAFLDAVRRRAGREPLQYITGVKGFRYLELAVDGRALIPRPETEMLVERAVQIIQEFKGHPTVVDVGTGTGCIALSLARECPAAVVYATDISAEAIGLALLNARRLGLDGLVSFHRGDLLDALDGEPAVKFDLVVSNPPYIREEDFPELPPEVMEHEPYLSLVAGPAGTEVHLRLMEQAARRLVPGGVLIMEGAEDQVERLASISLEAGYREARVYPDLGGRPRIAEMRLSSPR